MQVTEERKGAQVSLKIEVPKEKVKEEFFRAFQKIAKETTVPGFRRGRVPRKIFEQRFGKKIIQEEVFKSIYSKIYQEAVEEKNIVPITTPEVEIIQLSENQSLILKINLITKPEIKLSSYKGIKIKRKKVKVTKEEVEQGLKNLQKRYTQYHPVKNRVTKNGDWLYLNCQNLSEEKFLPRDKENDFWYQLGSPNLPSSFQKELLGTKVGETKKIEAEFPLKDSEKNIPNRKVNLNVKIKEVREEKLPPLDDEFVKKLNFQNLEDLKNSIRKNIKKFKNQQEERKAKSKIVQKVVEESTIEIPPSLVEKEVESKIDKLKKDLKNKNSTLSDYLKEQNLSEEAFRENVKLKAKQDLKTFFVLDKIAENEKIEVKEEETDQVLKASVKEEMGEEKLKRLRENLKYKGVLGGIINQIKEGKVVDFLYQQADVSESFLPLTKK
ncbi:trigger factor [Patescibacteria group bacterium]|nr:trigger factor [Patescibacteria group bacterium]